MKAPVSQLLGSGLLAASVAIASSVMAPSSAQAFSVSFGPTSTSSNSPATGASATVDFSFSQVDANSVLLNLNLLNTTGQIPPFGSGATQSTLVGFGFDLLNSITSFTYNSLSSPFTKLFGDQSLTSQTVEGPATLQPFGTFDVGIRSSGPGNFNGGNPQTGLTAGQSADVSFVLSGTNLIANDVESAFQAGFQDGTLKIATRFQEVNAGEGSDKLLGGTVEPPESVPEPSTLAGLAFVIGGMIVSRRRNSR